MGVHPLGDRIQSPIPKKGGKVKKGNWRSRKKRRRSTSWTLGGYEASEERS